MGGAFRFVEKRLAHECRGSHVAQHFSLGIKRPPTFLVEVLHGDFGDPRASGAAETGLPGFGWSW